MARALHECVRADDVVARYGGEEPVLIISSDPEEDARVAERVRE